MGLIARLSNSTEGDAQPLDVTSDEIPTSKRSLQQQRRLLQTEIGQLVTAYLNGSTINELAATWGIHRTTVMEHLKRTETPTRPGGRKLTDQQVSTAAEQYRAGQSLAQLATHFCVSPETIRRELLEAGVVMRRRGRHWSS